jgi:hypothetical protein
LDFSFLRASLKTILFVSSSMSKNFTLSFGQVGLKGIEPSPFAARQNLLLMKELKNEQMKE